MAKERRASQTQFTKREILEIVNDANNNPYEGSLGFKTPFSDALAGQKLRILLHGRDSLNYEFINTHSLRRLYLGKWREEYYECFEAAPNILFLYHMHNNSIPPKMTAMCLDLNTGLVTINNAQIGNYDYTPRDTSNQISFGAIDRANNNPAEFHCFTDDFVGKVAAWNIGDIWLTHHYVNPHFFLNEILGADGIFLTIAEPAQYVKITENIYVFIWREMAGPGLMGMDVMDWSRMQSVGMFYGISEDDRLECYGFSRKAGKWLSIEERKRMHKEGIHSVVG